MSSNLGFWKATNPANIVDERTCGARALLLNTKTRTQTKTRCPEAQDTCAEGPCSRAHGWGMRIAHARLRIQAQSPVLGRRFVALPRAPTLALAGLQPFPRPQPLTQDRILLLEGQLFLVAHLLGRPDRAGELLRDLCSPCHEPGVAVGGTLPSPEKKMRHPERRRGSPSAPPAQTHMGTIAKRRFGRTFLGRRRPDATQLSNPGRHIVSPRTEELPCPEGGSRMVDHRFW